MATPPKKRPTGVTILAILAILSGLALLALGPLTLLGAALLAELDPSLADYVVLLQVLGAVMTIMGILYLVGAVGLLKMTVWGWWLAIIVSLISVISNITQAVINPAAIASYAIGLVIPVIILIYLFLVRGHFGTGAPKMA